MNDSPIMRRCKDDWVNATQILKCCNFPKAKRTKILEKGVQSGLHEKIQGGFGRFQGTWIPLPDAKRLAATYGVTEEQAPVLFLDSSDPNLDIPHKQKPNAKDPTPVKRKYVKRKNKLETPTKKYKSEPNSESQIQLQPHPSDYVNQTMQYQMNTQMNTHLNNQMQTQIPNANYQMPPSQQEFSMNRNDKVQDYNYQLMQQQLQQQKQQLKQQQLFNKSQNPQFQSLPYPMSQPVMPLHNRMSSSQSTNETNWSQEEISRSKESDTSISSNEEKSKLQNPNRYIENVSADVMMNSKLEEGTYASQLLKFFSDDTSEIPYFIYNPPFDFNVNEPIDDEGHTPLHWAASIGNHTMIRLLLSKGASPLVVNNFGLNPLSKLISFNNCYELKNFPKVLDDLELCLINTDINGRTPLHYLCQFAKVKSKYDSLRYYLNIILSKLTTMSNQNPSKQVDLLRNVLDHQDVNGDTCLLLAAKSGSAKVVRFLLGYGARDDLENINKETAKMVLQNNCILPEYALQQEQLWQQLSYQQNGNVNQFSQEMPPQFVQPQMDGINNTNQFQPMLETPVQPAFRNGGVAETPDTQRTAIQEDDMDDESETARVDKAHLDNLSDNKENVFMDGKTYEVSTPISKDSNGLQPLGVISENAKPFSEPTKKPTCSSVQQFQKPNPPKLDSEGRLVTRNDKKLSMKDLSSMLCTMISSLSDSHDQTLQALEEECKRIEEQLEQKRSINDETLTKLKTMLEKIGLVEFDSVEEGKKLLGNELTTLSKQVEHQELALRRILERNQAYHLANTVQELESAYNETETAKDESKEQKWKYAIELTHLQQERTKLMHKLTYSMKQFGIDSKMYKYRKLISSSCGLKVEEIDGLIDGIEESLVESIP